MIGYFIHDSDNKKTQQYYTLSDLLHKLFEWEDRLSWSFSSERHYQYKVEAETAFHSDIFRSGLHITAVVITDLRTNKVVASWKHDETTKTINDPYCRGVIAPVIISMSHKGVNILTDLSQAMFTTIRETKRMPKLLWVREGTSVKNILRNPQLTKWLPADSSFDIRHPPEEYVYGNKHKLVAIDTQQRISDQASLTWEEVKQYRWIDWCEPDSMFGGTGIAPMEFAPPDGAILAIPMKHVKDRSTRDWIDEYRMMVQIRHRNKITDTPPTAMERQNEMYMQFAKTLKAQQSEKSE